MSLASRFRESCFWDNIPFGELWLLGCQSSLIGLALAVFIAYFIIYAFYAWSLFQFPFDYDQGEGFELMDTVLFSQGEWPYRDNNSYPFYSSNYPPLFHVVTVPLVWLFGPQYWTGRLVSFLGTIITAVAIGYAVQRKGKRWWLSALAGLTFLASNYVYHVGPLFRQHMFMVMFETLAVVLMAVTIDLGREGWQETAVAASFGHAAAPRCRLYKAACLCHGSCGLYLLLSAPNLARNHVGCPFCPRHRGYFSLDRPLNEWHVAAEYRDCQHQPLCSRPGPGLVPPMVSATCRDHDSRHHFCCLPTLFRSPVHICHLVCGRRDQQYHGRQMGCR